MTPYSNILIVKHILAAMLDNYNQYTRRKQIDEILRCIDFLHEAKNELSLPDPEVTGLP